MTWTRAYSDLVKSADKIFNLEIEVGKLGQELLQMEIVAGPELKKFCELALKHAKGSEELIRLKRVNREILVPNFESIDEKEEQ